MKKRKFANLSTVLKICTGSLMAMTVLTGQHASIGPWNTGDLQVLIVSPAAPQSRGRQRHTVTSRVCTQYELQAAAPVNVFYGDNFCESTLSKNSCEDSSSPEILKGQVYIVTLDLPQPAPPPMGLYILSLLALGVVGFLFGAPPAAARLAHRRKLSSRMHNEGSRL
jgi:hypothetical protein